MSEPVHFTGGDGTLLSAALALSLATGRGFRIRGFRAEESPPGLRPEHLSLLRAASTLAGQRLAEVAAGDTEVAFGPADAQVPVRGGDFLLEVGGSVSAPAVLECLHLGLALSGGGTLTLRGGTHGLEGPLFHALSLVWLPAMRAYGFDADLRLRSAGFPPEGAGEMRARVAAASGQPPALVELLARGTLVEAHVTSFVAGMALSHAERQSRAAVQALRECGIPCFAETLPLPAARPQGGALLVRAHFENTVVGFGAVSGPGEPPEAVGRRAAQGLCAFMEGPGALDPHVSEQLVLPAALLAAGRLGPSSPGTTRYQAPATTPALRTLARVAEAFLPVRVALSEQGLVEVAPGAS